MKSIVIVGAGPAGLMAAQVLADAGVAVQVFDAMPSVGRKFLLAGKGGLNLTHAEPFEAFAGRYADRRPDIEPLLQSFGAAEVRAWAQTLGIETFVGSSGRVFPVSLKAAPLLRAWLRHLRHPPAGAAVQFRMRQRWLGWLMPTDAETDCRHRLRFASPDAEHVVTADALVLALGGASWPQLGSDGAWVALLRQRAVDLAALRAANCGFDVGWSEHFASRFAGLPFKSVALSVSDAHGLRFQRKGEFVATRSGVEGSLIYAASALLRDQIERDGWAELRLDLLPDRSLDWVQAQVAHPRGSRSRSSHLKSRLHLDGIKAALLHEVLGPDDWQQADRLAAAIKSLPLRLLAARPISEAISSAGGVRFEGLDQNLMLRGLPGVFCAGEMLDWEAPTGGYLMTACLSSGRRAGLGVLQYLQGSGPALARDRAEAAGTPEQPSG